ncbi:sugar kinase [Actinokineospora sp. HUAS TT18]|uniref:sugar kinase n=1 Tax=Actinokineospora sp. HUAS TT18 TaxID=3447451 RepID=UPI003F5290DE
MSFSPTGGITGVAGPERPLVQCVGECMLEIARESAGRAAIGYAGDTYNTAVYLRRVAAHLGAEVDVRYLTGLGGDAESDRMRESWHAQGVGDDALVVVDRTVGAYLISTDSTGERSFTYWRGASAAARTFADAEWISHLRGDLIVLSGITLQLTSTESRAALVARLGELRGQGSVVAFDNNFRSGAWPSADHARTAMAELLGVTDIALVTLDDEVALGAAHDVESCGSRLERLGVREAVIKVGPEGAWVNSRGVLTHVPTEPVSAVDTTAAGDSFNGGYLAARVAGLSPVDAAKTGNRLAARVVSRRGAIIDHRDMPFAESA